MKTRIKKLAVLVVMVIVTAFYLAGCNKIVFDFNNKFEYAYIKIGDNNWQTVKIKQWNDYNGEQLQLVLEDGTIMVIHSLNCILYNGTLPM